MNKMKKSLLAMSILVGTCVAPVAALQSLGQELTDAQGNTVSSNAAVSQQKSAGGFYDIVFGSGIVGMILWFALFGDGALAIYFGIDSSILIKSEKLMPKKLMDGVTAAMAEGDVVKAMEVCQQNPSAMSSIVYDGGRSPFGIGVTTKWTPPASKECQTGPKSDSKYDSPYGPASMSWFPMQYTTGRFIVIWFMAIKCASIPLLRQMSPVCTMNAAFSRSATFLICSTHPLSYVPEISESAIWMNLHPALPDADHLSR